MLIRRMIRRREGVASGSRRGRCRGDHDGCGYLGESPDDVDAITMTRAEAERTIIDGVEAVAAGEQPVLASDPMQYGCVSAAMSMPTGPPWYYTVLRSYDHPTDEQIANWRRRIMALTSQGYELQPATRRRDSRDIGVRDPRGFQVYVVHHTDSAGVTEDVSIRASSPCVRDP